MADQRQQVLDYLATQKYAVLASVNQAGDPNAAFIGFGFTDQFEFIFGTGSTTRKYANVSTHQRVAFVVGGNERITVQYEGIAEVLAPETAEPYKEAYFAKNPDARRFANEPSERFFKVTPLWLRYSDHNQQPKKIFELSFPKTT